MLTRIVQVNRHFLVISRTSISPHFWTKSCQTVTDLVKNIPSGTQVMDHLCCFCWWILKTGFLMLFQCPVETGCFFFKQYITWTSWRWDIHSWGSFWDSDPWATSTSAFGGCGAQFGDVAGHPSSLHLWPEIRGGDRDHRDEDGRSAQKEGADAWWNPDILWQ